MGKRRRQLLRKRRRFVEEEEETSWGRGDILRKRRKNFEKEEEETSWGREGDILRKRRRHFEKEEVETSWGRGDILRKKRRHFEKEEGKTLGRLWRHASQLYRSCVCIQLFPSCRGGSREQSGHGPIHFAMGFGPSMHRRNFFSSLNFPNLCDNFVKKL